MIRKACKAQCVINSVLNLIDDLVDQNISEIEWNTAEKVYRVLESEALVTENQSGATFFTLSIRFIIFDHFYNRCTNEINGGDETVSSVAGKLLLKQNQYRPLIM